MPRLMKMGLISGKPANLDTRYIPSFKVSKILKEYVNNNILNNY